MDELKSGNPGRTRDRKLGDEWIDWKGQDSGEVPINERLSTFLSLATTVLFGCALALLFAWFMIKPRLEQMNPAVADFTGWAVIACIAALLLAVFFETAALLKRGRSVLPYKWIRKFFIALLPKVIWLGGKIGISKDRIGNSFIKIHNAITRSHIRTLGDGRLLVLLPRCLKREARMELTGRIHGDNVKVVTAAGGEQAREAIKEYRPEAILAVACERDLMSGIKDVADRIPVLAVPNIRPEGPCKNTELSFPELEEALKILMPKARG
jgi:hypothetical protein